LYFEEGTGSDLRVISKSRNFGFIFELNLESRVSIFLGEIISNKRNHFERATNKSDSEA